jgi:outer membrane beta-barrel protein
MTHEFGAWVGTLPLDAFEKGLTFTGAYSIHFTDFIAWEVGQYTYSQRIEMDLKDELQNVCGAKATEFEVVKYFATSSLVLKPLYGKFALLNRRLLFGEIFILAGGGYGWMTLTSRPVADVGAGIRIYAGSYVSFRFDFRDYMFINADDFHNEIWIALGMSLSFG